MQNLRLAIFATLLFTIALAIASLALPLAEGWDKGWLLYHIRIIVALCIPALHVIAALFFFLGLQGFKEELRKAYTLIAVGVTLIGFCLLASPVVTVFNLWDTWFMVYGIPNIPFIIPMIIMMAGLRAFFRTLNIKSVWRHLWFSAAFIAVGVVLVLFVPHKPSPLPEIVYDTGNALFALSSLFLMAVGINLLVIRRHLSPAYAKVLLWLGIGVLMESMLVGTSIITKAIGLEARSLANLQDVLLLTVIPYLRAGVLFYKLTADTRPVASERNATAVDIVLYVASLASDANKVDPILDGVRDVTSRLREGEPLSVTDQAALGEVYLTLERYLTEQESLRAFTVEKLRQHVHQKFKQESLLSAGHVFWDKLPLAQPTITLPTQPKQIAHG